MPYIPANLIGAAVACVAYDWMATPRKIARPIQEAVTEPDRAVGEPVPPAKGAEMAVATHVMKKFINDPADVVKESLAGLAAAHPDLVRVDFESRSSSGRTP